MKRVTIKDIARHLCLSPSTVSRALADDKNIRQETKEIIYKAADELGYRRNRLAVSLRSGKTNTVGVIVDEMTTPSSLHILAGAEKMLHTHGINMMVANSEGDALREKANLRMMEGALVDGLIVCACGHEENCAEFIKLRTSGVPLVFLHTPPCGIVAASVSHCPDSDNPDSYLMGEKGAELLMKIIDNPSHPPVKITL
jgi:periplasmic binding protein and sugar binding domain of the lacI family protein